MLHLQIRQIKKMSNKGMTLTELLIASVMIGIVMVGVAGFSASLKNLSGEQSSSGIVQMQMAALLKELRKDAELAIGDNTAHAAFDPLINPDVSPCNTGNIGVGTGICAWKKPSGAGSKGFTICFRHDDPANPSPADYTLGDRWKCYFVEKGSGKMSTCIFNYATIAGLTDFPIKDKADCRAFDWTPPGPADEAVQRFFELENQDFFEIIFNSDGRGIHHIEFTIDSKNEPDLDSQILSVSPLSHSRR